jgi:hypothetical protein
VSLLARVGGLLAAAALLTPALPQQAGASQPTFQVRQAAQVKVLVGPARASSTHAYLQRLVADPAPGPARSTWQVSYTGFTPQAQAAFQAAVDIWSRLIASPVPIKVDASFASLDPGVLGSAGAANWYKRTGLGDGVSWYPGALADALSGSDVGGTDIDAQFSNTYGFYFGIDGATPSGQIDFESVVLHELGHGLGFAGFADDAGSTGSFDASGRFDAFTYDAPIGGSRLLSYPDPSAALATALTSGSVYWGGPAGVASNGGVRPRLYAPGSWQVGSSYSHLDEATYPANTANSLMTYAIGPGESIHSPGPIVIGMLNDLGYQAAIPAVTSTQSPEASALSDTSAPLLTVATTAAFSLATTTGVSFSAVDAGSGVASYLVRVRRAPYNGLFGAYGATATTTADRYVTAAPRGWTTCLSIAARDGSGNTTRWSLDRCTTVPLDDRSLAATSAYRRLTASAAWAGTYSRVAKAGQYVRLSSAVGRRVVLVATTCSTCGSVRVTLGSAAKTVTLATATTHWRALIVIDFDAVRSGPLTVTSTSARPVYVDGVGVARA